MMRLLLFLLVGLCIAANGWAELPSAGEGTIRMALASGKPTVIDLGARTCIPCKKMAPILETMSREYQGKAHVLFVDVHESQDLAKKFRVQMIPTQIFFDIKGAEIKRHMGFMDKTEIVKELKAAGLK